MKKSIIQDYISGSSIIKTAEKNNSTYWITRKILLEAGVVRTRAQAAKIMENSGQFEKGHRSWQTGVKGEAYLSHYENGQVWNKGKKTDEETRKKISNSVKESMKHVPYEKLAYWKGKRFSDEHRKHKSESIRGTNHPNWRGGISTFPYPPEFNKTLKERIQKRDDYLCQECYTPQKPLVVHHIDGNKQNSELKNLISYCRSCHMKIERGGQK